MTPLAARPARARKCAAGLSEARLAVRVTFAAGAECIPVTTLALGRQTSRTTGSRAVRYSAPASRQLRGVPTGSFAATDSVIHVISPPKSGHAER
jgi:hypothetical protein